MDYFIIGGGPSCKGFDWSLLSGLETLGCNNSAKAAGTKYLVSSDHTWINRYQDVVLEYGDRAHVAPSVLKPIGNANIYNRNRTQTICVEPGFIAGCNSGHSAINAAFHLADKTVQNTFHLLGFDFNELGHWHGGYNFGKQLSRWMDNWAEEIDRCKPVLDRHQIDVICWNVKSGLKAYDKKPIETLPEYLKGIQ